MVELFWGDRFEWPTAVEAAFRVGDDRFFVIHDLNTCIPFKYIKKV